MTRGYADIGGQSLRIFLSSTFRDMSGERELLMKKYVPALRQARARTAAPPPDLRLISA